MIGVAHAFTRPTRAALLTAILDRCRTGSIGSSSAGDFRDGTSPACAPNGRCSPNATSAAPDLERVGTPGVNLPASLDFRERCCGTAFRKLSLLGSTFEDCRLRPIVFDEADFTLAVLGGADLRGVDLSGCRLRETGLVGADLHQAVLRGADLSGACTNACARAEPTYAAPASTPRCGRRRRAAARASTSRRVAHAVAHGLDVSG